MNPTVHTLNIHKPSLSQTHVMIKVIIITNIYQKSNICSYILFRLRQKTKRNLRLILRFDLIAVYNEIEEWSCTPLLKLHHLTVKNSSANTINLLWERVRTTEERGANFETAVGGCGLQWIYLFKIITKCIGTNKWGNFLKW